MMKVIGVPAFRSDVQSRKALTSIPINWMDTIANQCDKGGEITEQIKSN